MHSNKVSLLVVDDEPAVLQALSALLAREFELLTADSAESALGIFSRRSVDMVLTDQRLPGLSGIQLLEWVRQHSPHTVRLLMTGLARFEDAVEAINCGQVSRYLFKPWHAEELLHVLRDSAKTFLLERSHERLLDELRTLNLELEERVRLRTLELQEANHQLQQKNWMLEKLALTDPLTGMPNRRAMDQLARTELIRRDRFPSPMTLGLIDVDHFKEINARYLLPGGDQVLIDLGKALVAAVRTIDSVGRIGGEEFEVVAPETSLEGARVLGERIRLAVETSRFFYKGETIPVTASAGYAVAESGVAVSYEQLKHLAAACLAEAKNTGRNRCVVRACDAATHAELEA